MSKKKYKHFGYDGIGRLIISNVDDPNDCLTATPREIYDALDKVGREVPITYRGKIITDGASCRKCNFVLSETNIENAHCDLGLDKSSTHHENTPSPACPGAGDYEVVLRRKGVSGDDR